MVNLTARQTHNRSLFVALGIHNSIMLYFLCEDLKILFQISHILSSINLTNERFLVPEVLFSPTDIGINQLGIGEIIKEITSKRVPSSFEHIMFRNIVIGGGNTKTPGFK